MPHNLPLSSHEMPQQQEETLSQLLTVATTVLSQALGLLKDTVTTEQQLVWSSQHIPGSTIGKASGTPHTHTSCLSTERRAAPAACARPLHAPARRARRRARVRQAVVQLRRAQAQHARRVEPRGRPRGVRGDHRPARGAQWRPACALARPACAAGRRHAAPRPGRVLLRPRAVVLLASRRASLVDGQGHMRRAQPQNRRRLWLRALDTNVPQGPASRQVQDIARPCAFFLLRGVQSSES